MHKKDNKEVFVGIFKPVKDMQVIDFTKLSEIPSIFNEERRHLRPYLIFLHNFVQDLSKPIKKDGREHIDYVPTQVMTEYFRHIYKNFIGESVMGIIYPSARQKEGISVVLFLEQKDCGRIKRSRGKLLELQSIVKQR